MQVDFYDRDERRFLTQQFVTQIYAANLIVEAPRGGLVLGPSHDEGGIIMFTISGSEFEVIAEVEGWKFLANPFLTSSHSNKIETINSEFDGKLPFLPYHIPTHIRTIDAKPTMQGVNKWILLGSAAQWIVNRHSTKKYLEWLNTINNETWSENVER